MATDIGEYIVGAYLKTIKGCDFIDYNVRTPGGGMRGLEELDVVGIDFKNKTVYLCEATTHIRGALYVNNETTVRRIHEKFKRQKRYADEYLPELTNKHFMFWSPVVPEGYITKGLAKIKGLELVINGGYSKCIEELNKKAKDLTHDTGNPFFRTLQILGHLRQPKVVEDLIKES